MSYSLFAEVTIVVGRSGHGGIKARGTSHRPAADRCADAQLPFSFQPTVIPKAHKCLDLSSRSDGINTQEPGRKISLTTLQE